MGTNFYWREELILPPDDNYNVFYSSPHIGKRSAAGNYCWDCDLTLCMGGTAGIHTGRSGWSNHCPSCGKEPDSTSGWSGAAAIELGFAKPETSRPTGVRSTSSFTWAQDPEHVGASCDQHPDEQIIEDEYGRMLTGREFKAMLLANCAVQFTDFIGQQFS